MATVNKTQSRRQSGLVCSLLVVSLLLSAVVGREECVQGILPAETVSIFGPSGQVPPFTFSSRLYVFPSMNFSCSGTITDIRMRMHFKPGLPADGSVTQEVVVYLLLFHDGLDSPTRRVSHILLNQSNTQQESPNEIWRNSDPLSLPVSEGTFIGFAVPSNRYSTTLNKNINLSPTSERVEAHIHQLSETFSEFAGRLLEAARTANSSRFTTQMIAPPLIDVTFSKWSSHFTHTSPRPDSSTIQLSPTTTVPHISHSITVGVATTDPAIVVQDKTIFIIIAVVLATVMFAVAGLVVAAVSAASVCLRRKKRRLTLSKEEENRGGKCPEADGEAGLVIEGESLKNTDEHIYDHIYEPVVAGQRLNHYDTPLPLSLPPQNPRPIGIKPVVIRSESNAYVVMQPGHAYNASEDTPTTAGDTPTLPMGYAYVQVAQQKQ